MGTGSTSSLRVIVAAVVAALAGACVGEGRIADIRDPQARCDALRALVFSPQWAGFEGKSALEVAQMLGPPDEVGTLIYNGITWVRISYTCAAAPSNMTAEERDRFEKGWRFSPSLLFRDGMVVSEAQFDREVVGEERTAIPPPHLMFQRGGRFP